MNLPKRCLEAVSSAGASGDSPPARPPAARPIVARGRWGRAAAAAALSLVPGCGHLFVGRRVSALLWTTAFLALVVPLEIAAYVLWAYRSDVFGWMALGVVVFFVLSARRPFLEAAGLSGRRPAPPRTPCSAYVLGAYALLVNVGASLEVAVFHRHYVREVRVEGDRLEPLLCRGDEPSVFLSRYVRPVHGEVVVFSSRGPRDGRTGAPVGTDDSPERLGLVLAKPGDAVEARDGELLVNGIAFDRTRRVPRLRIEREGRRERRRRLFFGLPPLAENGSAAPEATVDMGAEAAGEDGGVVWWDGVSWGPFAVPRDRFLLLPDVPSDVLPSERSAWLVSRTRILGRVLH